MTMSMVQTIPDNPGDSSDGVAFTRFAREFYDPVYYFIARQVGNQADAADLTQQAFVRGFKSFSRFDQRRDFAPWIYTIARRCLADFYRSRKGNHEPIDHDIPDPEANPDEAADRKDDADQIWDLASRLKPQQQQILHLFYKEGFSMRETARIMGISTTHAKVLVFRARSALKQQLQTSSTLGG